jgi:hypothetical protein
MKHQTVASLICGLCLGVSCAAQVPLPKAAAGKPKPLDAADQNNPTQEAVDECHKKAQFTAAYFYCDSIANYLVPVNTKKQQDEAVHLIRPASRPSALAQAIARRDVLLQAESDLQLEGQRLDKQMGAPPSATSSTNLVSKPGVPQLLSVAVESGALTKTQSSNTITLQGNLDQLGRVLIGKDGGVLYTSGGTPVLKNISLSSTLTLDAASTSNIPTSGSATSSAIEPTTASIPSTATKLGSISARYQFVNKYDPKSAAFQTAYKAAIFQKLANSTPESGALVDLFASVSGCDGYSPLFSMDDTIKKFNECFDRIVDDVETSKKITEQQLAGLAFTVNAVNAGNAQAYRDAIAKAAGTPFTLEYVYNKPPNQPDTHDFRSVLAMSLGDGILSANVAGSVYGTLRPSDATYGRFKDVQIATEFDRNFTGSSTSPSWSLAGYGQWQGSASVITLTAASIPSGITLPAGAQSFVTGTKGWLAVVQGKVIFKVAGAQIPVSAKWSSKTDLLDKSSLGGQFGVSYDLSQLKQLFGLGS